MTINDKNRITKDQFFIFHVNVWLSSKKAMSHKEGKIMFSSPVLNIRKKICSPLL